MFLAQGHSQDTPRAELIYFINATNTAFGI